MLSRPSTERSPTRWGAGRDGTGQHGTEDGTGGEYITNSNVQLAFDGVVSDAARPQKVKLFLHFYRIGFCYSADVLASESCVHRTSHSTQLLAGRCVIAGMYIYRVRVGIRYPFPDNRLVSSFNHVKRMRKHPHVQKNANVITPSAARRTKIILSRGKRGRKTGLKELT